MENSEHEIEKSERWDRVKQMICATGKCTRGRLRDIKQEIAELAKDECEKIYEDDHNLLHLAIKHNQSGIVEEFFEQGLFKIPHESATIPYLHMACFYRHKDVVDVLMKYRQDDADFAVSVDEECVQKYTTMFPPNGKNQDLHAQITASLFTNLTALEIASLYQDVELVTSIWSGLPKKRWLEETIKTSQSSVMAMLVASTEFEDTCLNDAFEKSLYYTSSACLEVLLKHAAQNDMVFLQSDPYHFLYKYSFTENEVVNDAQAECTSLLIQYGYDVNAMKRPATFPLYSLLHLSFDVDSCDSADYDNEISCLEKLMRAGANPTFDETTADCGSHSNLAVSSFESVLMEDCDYKRPKFSSGVEAVAHLLNLSNFNTNNLSLWEIVLKSVTLCVEHGCCLSVRDEDGMTILRNMCDKGGELFGTYDCSEELLLIVRRIINILLLQGADLHDTNEDRDMPLSSFTEVFADSVEMDIDWVDAGENEMSTKLCDRVKPFVKLLNGMRLDLVYEEVNAAIIHFNAGLGPAIPNVVKERLRDMLNSYIGTVRSLCHQCMIKVWYCSQRKLKNVESLEIPSQIKEEIVGLFRI